MNDPSAHELLAACVAAANAELDAALARIRHCVDQLSEEQLWQRPREEMNSIGNLLLHLAGNVRQWLICGVGGKADHRRRPEEFAATGGFTKEQLLDRLEAIVAEAQAALARPTPADMLRRRVVQTYDVDGFSAIFGSVPHFRGHTQEIISMTRHMLGPTYRFAFVPQTKEQGA